MEAQSLYITDFQDDYDKADYTTKYLLLFLAETSPHQPTIQS